MATVALRRFTNPDTLKHIGNRLLNELLSPHRIFFAGRGLELPGAAEGEVDCEKLAGIFMTPDTDMPRDLAEALFNIHEMSTKEAMDELLEAAEQHRLELNLPADAEPADVAVRLWLHDKTLFEEIHAEHHLRRPKSFIYFITNQDPVPQFTAPTRETLAAMEGSMDNWFEKKRRGRGCRVFVYPKDGECWFMVRHGEPCRREGSLENGNPSSIFYRPQQHDILVYDAARGEIRIHTGTKGERVLYLKTFGAYLFGREDFFPEAGKFTLAPLAQGSSSLNCLDVEGIEWVRLREIEVQWGHGTNAEREIRKAADLFATFERRGHQIRADDSLKRAVFHVKFVDAKAPRSVTITPSNQAKYERDDDSAYLELWLRKRKFIKDNEDDEADSDLGEH
jgi:hypothetical protein